MSEHMLIRHNVGIGGYHGKTATPISAEVADLLLENDYIELDARLDLFGDERVTHYYRRAGHEPVFANDERNLDRDETATVVINGIKYTITGPAASSITIH